MGTKTQWGLGSKVKEEDLAAMENRLQGAFQPVGPRPEFVKDLGYRLSSKPESDLDLPKPGIFQFVFLAAASLLSGTVLLVLLYRGVSALLGSRGLLQKVNVQVDPNCSHHLNQAVT